MARPSTPSLAWFFRRNGVLRTPSVQRRKKKPQTYKKGYEIRLVAFDKDELRRIRGLLRENGFTLAAPFIKGQRYVQPVYGKEAVEKLREIIG